MRAARPEIKAQGETWAVGVDRHEPHPGVRAIVFHCVSNPQRPYRVVEVPLGVADTTEALADLSEEQLVRLLEGADFMDYVHEAGADPLHPGGHPLPPPPPGEHYREQGKSAA
jgi:hypothetical protein